MANTYSSSTFVIDTSTNVAGLTALKGGAPTTSDHICVWNLATLTIESNLSFNSLNIGYGAVNGASNGIGHCIINDNIILTQLDGARIYCRYATSSIVANGTLRSLGTGTGAADQSYAQLDAVNRAVKVNGVWWQWRPYLTGEMVAVTAVSNTTTITCTVDPRRVGVYIGASIEIRTRSTGALIATKTVTAMTATTIGWASGNVSVTANESVYIVIGSSEQVYTTLAGNVVFGDGSASTYNNNGGAVCPNGATITSPGITWKGSAAVSGLLWYSAGGRMTWTGVCTYGHSYSNAMFQANEGCVFTDCAFTRSITYATLYIYSAKNITLTRVLCFDSITYGLMATQVKNLTLTGYKAYGCVAAGVYFNSTRDTVVTSPEVFCTGGSYSGGITANGCDTMYITNALLHHNWHYGFSSTNSDNIRLLSPTIYSNGFSGFFLGYVENDVILTNPLVYSHPSVAWAYQYYAKTARIYGCRQYSNSTPSAANCAQDEPCSMYYRTASSGEAGEILWRCGAVANPGGTFEAEGSLFCVTKDEYFTGAPIWVPGLSAYGVVTLNRTLPSSSTLDWQYSVSHDGGISWTAWVTKATGESISDTPDILNEWIKFRVCKSDAGAGIPYMTSVQIACTFSTGWVAPDSWCAFTSTGGRGFGPSMHGGAMAPSGFSQMIGG